MPDPSEKKPGKFRSLTAKLAIALLIFSVMILLIADAMDVMFSLNDQQELIGNQQKLIGENAANTVRGFIQEKIVVMKSTSTIGNLAASGISEQRTVLEKLLGVDPSFRQIALLDPEKNELARVSRTSDLFTNQIADKIDDNLFSQLKLGKPFIGQVYIDEITSEPLTVIAVPVTNLFGDFEGILAAEVNLKFMWDLVGSLDIGKNGRAYVVDRQGRLIAFGDVSRVLRGENLAHLSGVSQFMQSKSQHPEHPVEISTGILGTKVISLPVFLGTPDWAVIIEQPVAEAYHSLILKLQVAFGVVLLSILLAIGGSIYLSKRITKPIIELKDAVGSMGKGNLDVQIRMESEDEIGNLAAAFNQMAKDLKESRDKLKEYSENLEKKVKERTEELEMINRLAVGRELNMIELKKKIKELEEKLQNK